MTDLILPLKRKWFDQIKAGTKTEEYRLCNDYWRKRLVGKSFEVMDMPVHEVVVKESTAQVAQSLGRRWIGCEINPEYHAMQARLTAQLGMQL